MDCERATSGKAADARSILYGWGCGLGRDFVQLTGVRRIRL